MNLRGGHPAGVPLQVRAAGLPLLQVTGEGRLTVIPDTAELLLGVSARTEQATIAYRQTAAVMNQIVASLMEAGLAQNQIQTSRITLQPRYDEERLIGYEGAASVRVTLKDLAEVGNVIDQAVAAGATTIGGIHFTVQNPGPYESRALTLAVQDASSQAATLARSLGLRLGPAWRVEAEPATGPVRPATARIAGLEAMPVLPGTLELARRVRVAYLLQPR